jgi:hypothetical protein
MGKPRAENEECVKKNVWDVRPTPSKGFTQRRCKHWALGLAQYVERIWKEGDRGGNVEFLLDLVYRWYIN